jgi:hypothetical protein
MPWWAKVMGKIATAVQTGWAFGVRDGWLRLEYELKRSAGLLARRMRAVQGWDTWRLERIAPHTSAEELLKILRSGERPFFFSDCRQLTPELKRMVGREGERAVQVEGRAVLAGTLPFFGRPVATGSFPPDWFRNPVTGQSVTPDRPWTGMRFASEDYGDLKFILEPSRFLFVYPLARAYALSGDEQFCEAFWIAVEDWARNNPPMVGPLWICGQESSLRILAWSFALYAFLHSPSTTPRRLALLLSLIAAHAWRTEQTIGYARSQRSNHLFSEAVGLWTAGTLFPELGVAGIWQKRGAALLREAALDQITREGEHLQYSFNYQRMILHLLLWVVRLGQIRGITVHTDVRARTDAALTFLSTFVDAKSGRVPNYGSNDGADILPLSGCDYGDYRPLAKLGACILEKGTQLEAGPWDEAALWLCGNAVCAERAQSEPDLSVTPGYHRLGSDTSWAMVRAGRYRRRPFQADQLHVDLWWRGMNLACDAGTYLYNGTPPWDNGLAGTMAHNTVMVDGRDQMRRAGRFLWLDWAQASGTSTRTGDSEFPNRFVGEHDGYRNLGITQRRTVQQVGEDAWVIVDDLLGRGEHELRLHWLAPDWPCEVVTIAPFCVVLSSSEGKVQWNIYGSAPGSAAVIRGGKKVAGQGDDGPLAGWQSPTYGELLPAISLICVVKAPLPVRFVTTVSIGEAAQVRQEENQVVVECGKERHEVNLAPDQSTG